MELDVRVKAHRAAARGLPPQLPAADVEELPFFGRSWYVRGIGYYLRRLFLTYAMTMGVFVATVLEASIFHAGTEIRMSDVFFVRAGYNTSAAGGLTAGLGILTPISFGSDDSSNWWESAAGNIDWEH